MLRCGESLRFFEVALQQSFLRGVDPGGKFDLPPRGSESCWTGIGTGLKNPPDKGRQRPGSLFHTR